MAKEKVPKFIFQIREVIKNLDIPENVRPTRRVMLRFIHYVEAVSDPRLAARTKYPLPQILLIGFLAVLGGASEWTEMECFAIQKEKFLRRCFPRFKPAPSHDTFRRVFGLIDPVSLSETVTAFFLEGYGTLKHAAQLEEPDYMIISVDGKEAKSTGRKYDTSEKVRNLQTLNIYDVTNGISLASVPIAEKTNEIPAAQQALAAMQLKNCVVTFDAMNTQTKTIDVIVEQGGDYVGGLKGNHPLMHSEVSEYFSDKELQKLRKSEKTFFTITEKLHNRIETRSYWLSTDIKWFADLEKWKNLKSFVCCVTETEDLVTGKKTRETHYYISSKTDIKVCTDAIRSHWGVENQLHWHLDVAFGEDDNSTMDKNAFNNLSVLNKLALSLYKLIQPTKKIGIKGIRKAFGWNFEGNIQLLSLFDEETVSQAMLNYGAKKR